VGLSKEYVALSSENIHNGLNGDCVDFAVLICSSMLAIGGEARLNMAANENSGHAFTEVNIGKTNPESIKLYLAVRYLHLDPINFRVDQFGNTWLNLDWFGNSPGGPYFEYPQISAYYPLQNYCE
jgi:hypothetical protein